MPIFIPSFQNYWKFKVTEVTLGNTVNYHYLRLHPDWRRQILCSSAYTKVSCRFIMPKCIITKCPHKTGGKCTTPCGIILHGFPNSIDRIKEWLLQTGQSFEHLDEIADIILEGKRSDLYRLCSTHFVEDSYVNTGKRKKLKSTAVPTIFPEPAEGRTLIEEFNILESRNRENQAGGDGSICFLCGMSPSGASNKIMHNQSTQTESSIWSPTVPQVEHIYLVTHSAPNVETAKSQETVCPNLGAQLPFECMEGPSGEDSVRALYVDPLSAFIEFSIPQLPSQAEEQHTQGSILAFTLGGGTKLEKNVDQRQDEVFKPLQESVYVSEKSARHSFLEDEQCKANLGAVGDPIADMVNESKYIVFEQCLNNLLRKVKCQDPSGCSKVVHKYNKEFHGSAVVIRGICEDGHYFRIWESQPKINRFYAGNILLAASLLTTGHNFQKIQTFLKCFGVRHISRKTFHHYQRHFIFPSIHDSWKAQQDQLQNKLQDTPIAICGKGQCDRPSHNSKFCVYTMMDMISNKILDFEAVQSTQCTSSTEMESHGFDICMTRALSHGQDIAFFASDRHSSVRQLMRTKYKNISHQYDVGHYVKHLKRKLTLASCGRSGIHIKPWISKILKHFWWSIQTSKGNAALLKEKWLSLLKHIQNIHTWHGGVLYHKCAHPVLSEEAYSRLLWLKEGTVAYDKVSEIICNSELMKDLDHLVWNCQTAALEVFQSNALKYHTKRTRISVDALEARTRLAAISHNHSIDRMPLAVRRFASAITPLGTKLATLKRKKKWLLHTMNEPMTNYHLIPILQDTLRIAEGTKTSTWVPKSPLMAPNIVKIEKPEKSDVVATQFSRFVYR
ncbi:hypothetical protein AB205_0205320 [Aquarana catesbeiana]|uniref:THAP-type domain-containing protein n=1 Tax=Aquarana catesbeiana TaxID=8400 RepID=A0A2G9RDY7_AQUCT|nr:hypothetical protein AB205_0205320 [Aquarana catesbeiana]